MSNGNGQNRRTVITKKNHEIKVASQAKTDPKGVFQVYRTKKQGVGGSVENRSEV